MKKIYTCLMLVFIASVFLSLRSFSQSPTVVTSSSDCGFVRNFNSSSEGFNSPSIYSYPDDQSFYWNSANGNEEETSGLTTRTASLISPIYSNTTSGQVSVGFKYSAPAGSEFRIRVIQAAPLNILAITSWMTLVDPTGSMCLLLTDNDFEAGQGIRFEFTFRTTAVGNLIFDDFGMSAANAPLPVTFLGFVAKKNDDATVRLSWDVANEIDVKGYYVEKSSNGIDYTSIGFIPATGKSVYTLTDNLSDTKARFYRVKNVDIDEKSKYSTIIKVSGLNPSNKIELYPVPAKAFINIQHEMAPFKGVVTLAELYGRSLIRKEVAPNTQQTNLYIAGLAPGLYIIRYEDGTGAIQTIKFVKE